jgi:hypothetical protein
MKFMVRIKKMQFCIIIVRQQIDEEIVYEKVFSKTYS